MSQIASFALIREDALSGLVEAAADTAKAYAAYLRDNAGASVTFPWSGSVFVTVLPYLQAERAIDLMRSEHDDVSAELTHPLGCTHFILTAGHRDEYLDRLDARRFSQTELRDYSNSFNAADDQDVGRPMLDGIRALGAMPIG
jgi:hypothetical protein